MEYASWLAGERWSDHPRCTHPLLASLARLVNDHTSDSARSRLVGFVPSVIGLNGDDPKVDVSIAIRCAAMAIPVVAEHRQRALAVSLLAAQRLLTDHGDGTHPEDAHDLLADAQRALDSAPHAARWAEKFTVGHDITLKAFRRRSAPAAVRISVVGIADAAISDSDGLLYELLTTVIDDCSGRLAPSPVVASEPREIIPST